MSVSNVIYYYYLISCLYKKATRPFAPRGQVTKLVSGLLEFFIIEFVLDITMLLDTEQKWLNWLFNLSRDFRYNFALPSHEVAEGLLHRKMLPPVFFMVPEVFILYRFRGEGRKL